MLSHLRFGTLLAALGLALGTPALSSNFKDPLEVPAVSSTLAISSMLTAVTRTPSGRLVAVGRRGHILTSDNGGMNWQQSPNRLSTDLVAVQFVDSRQGWAVGHGGIVLHSDDGGDSWRTQLDGHQAATLMVKHYESLDNDEHYARALADAKRFQEEDPGRPFLDVYFENPLSGFIVGAYNMIFHTSNGGKTWEPWSNRVPNGKGLHLNAIRPIGDDLYIVGEQGSMWRLDRQQKKFSSISTPYPGTYFGITGKTGLLIVFGLRGNAFRSEDGGSTWKKIETGTTSGLSAGAVVDDNQIVLVSLGGEILTGALGTDRLEPLKAERPMPYYGLIDAGINLVLVGAQGVRLHKFH